MITFTLLLSLSLAYFAHTCLGSKALHLETPKLDIFSKVKNLVKELSDSGTGWEK